MVAEARFTWRLVLSGTVRANEHLLDVLGVLRLIIADMDAQLAVRQRAVHVVDLPVALERVDEAFGILADERPRLPFFLQLQLEEVRVRVVVTDIFDIAVGEVLATASRHPQRVVDEEDSRLT